MQASTRRFSYSAAGVNAYRDYELARILYASHKRFDVLKRRDDVLRQQNVAMKRQTELLNLKAHAEKQAKSMEQLAGEMGRADALRRGRRQADVFGWLADKYLDKADAFDPTGYFSPTLILFINIMMTLYVFYLFIYRVPFFCKQV